MKKIIKLVVFLAVIQFSAGAANDKQIRFDQLPTQAQQFVKQHFSEQSIALVKMENKIFDKSYEVFFTNGDKIEFDRKGVWQDINCKYTQLPQEIVPEQINRYVLKNYPQARISKIEKESRNRYDVELTNGIELEFDSNFNVIDIDN